MQVLFTFHQIPIIISICSVLTGGIKLNIQMKIVCTTYGIELKKKRKGGKSEEQQKAMKLLEEGIECVEDTTSPNENRNRLTGMENKKDIEKIQECINKKLQEDLTGTEITALPTGMICEMCTMKYGKNVENQTPRVVA